LSAFFQASIPPFKKPKVLSNPTRARRVTVSSSLPSGVTNKMFWATFPTIAPTQGANPPSIPIKIDWGI
jgi:hypothetical protein